MKKIRLLSMIVFAISLLLLLSCGKKSVMDKELIGTYRVTESQQSDATDEDPGMMVAMDYTQEFKRDHHFELSGTIKMMVLLADTNYNNVLGFEYAITAMGDWNIKGDSLYQSVKPEDVEIVLIEALATEDDEIANYMMGTIQESVEVYFPEMKQSLNSSAEIAKIDSTEMILKSQGGVETVYKRLK